MTFLLGLLTVFMAFLAFIVLWLFVLAFLRASALDMPSDRVERIRLEAEIAMHAKAIDGLGRHLAALEVELRHQRPLVEVLPPGENFGAASRAYRVAAAAGGLGSRTLR